LFCKKIEVVICRTLKQILTSNEEVIGDAEVIEDTLDFIRKNKVIDRIIK
jgi:hypothetical protein